ncbi:prenyltransferase/squalene oxidase repeat-containing protein [Candidatus Riflebacteria bacterium]
MLPEKSHPQEIMQTLHKSIAILETKARNSIMQYLGVQYSAKGGFLNRGDEVDLYYTQFGLSCALVLNMELPLDNIKAYLHNFAPENLNLVDLSILVRCFSLLAIFKNGRLQPDNIAAYTDALAKFRTTNGSYSYDGGGAGFPYPIFLALNLLQDLNLPIPGKEEILNSLDSYRSADGKFFNPESDSGGMLLSTIAAILTIRQLTGVVDKTALAWVAEHYARNGGFKSLPESELPDLLSTAIALFSLSVCGYDMQQFKSSSQQFIIDHWLDSGEFTATLLDDRGDCEYTYYGLLALGALRDV